MKAYFNALKLDPSDTRLLFSLIENEDTGEVEIDDFVGGCLRMKGEAKSIDVQTLMFKSKQMHRTFGGLMDFVEEQFLWLEQRIAYLADAAACTPRSGGLEVRGPFAKIGSAAMPEGTASTADQGTASPAIDRHGKGLGGSTYWRTPTEEGNLPEVEVGLGLEGVSLSFGPPARPPSNSQAARQRAAGAKGRPQARERPGGDEGPDLLGKREDSCLSREGRHRSREGTDRGTATDNSEGRRRSRESTNRSQAKASRESSQDDWFVAPPGGRSGETSKEDCRMSGGGAAARVVIDTGGMPAAFDGDNDTPAGHENTSDSFFDADV